MTEEGHGFPDVTGWKYFGGPFDDQPVFLEPGWPAPSKIGRVSWTNGHYAENLTERRYEWVGKPLP